VDEVTGALRRRWAWRHSNGKKDRALRTKDRLTVVFIDVDGLKQVNDAVGHGRRGCAVADGGSVA